MKIFVRNRSRYNPSTKPSPWIYINVEDFAGTRISNIKEMCKRQRPMAKFDELYYKGERLADEKSIGFYQGNFQLEENAIFETCSNPFWCACMYVCIEDAEQEAAAKPNCRNTQNWTKKTIIHRRAALGVLFNSNNMNQRQPKALETIDDLQGFLGSHGKNELTISRFTRLKLENFYKDMIYEHRHKIDPVGAFVHSHAVRMGYRTDEEDDSIERFMEDDGDDWGVGGRGRGGRQGRGWNVAEQGRGVGCVAGQRRAQFGGDRHDAGRRLGRGDGEQYGINDEGFGFRDSGGLSEQYRGGHNTGYAARHRRGHKGIPDRRALEHGAGHDVDGGLGSRRGVRGRWHEAYRNTQASVVVYGDEHGEGYEEDRTVPIGKGQGQTRGEERGRQGNYRRGNAKVGGRGRQAMFCADCDGSMATLYCTDCGSPLCDNCSQRIHQGAIGRMHNITDISKAPRSISYTPKAYRAPFALLLALYYGAQEPQPLLSMSPDQVKHRAQIYTDTDLWNRSAGKMFGGFDSMDTTLEKIGFVQKEGAHSSRYVLQDSGKPIARRCAEFHESLELLCETHGVPRTPDQFRTRCRQGTVCMIIDNREPLRDRLLAIAQENNIPAIVRELAVGDFLWILLPSDINICRYDGDLQHREMVLPHVVERKTWDDLQDSVNSNRYQKQIKAMKMSGLRDLFYLLEGSVHDMKIRPTPENQISLENELLRLKVCDNFLVNYTGSWLKTVQWLCHLSTMVAQYHDIGENSNLMTYEEFDTLCKANRHLPIPDRNNNLNTGIAYKLNGRTFVDMIFSDYHNQTKFGDAVKEDIPTVQIRDRNHGNRSLLIIDKLREYNMARQRILDRALFTLINKQTPGLSAQEMVNAELIPSIHDLIHWDLFSYWQLWLQVHMGLHVCRTETVEETNKVQKMYEKYHNIPVSSSPSGQLQLSYIDDNDDNTNCNPAIHPLREQNENNHNRNKSFEVVSTIETGDYAPDSQTEEAMLQWALALSTQNNTGEDEEISLALETNAKETQTRQKEPMRRPKNGKTLNDVAATTVDDCPDSIPQERCKTPVNTLTETQSLKTQRSSRYRTPSGKYVRREMKENPTLRSSKKRKGTPDGGNGKKKSRIKLNVSQEDEDEELKKVLQLSLKECQHEAKVEDDLEKALALSLQETTIDGTLNDASKMSNDHKLDCDVPHLPCAGVAASQVYVNHQKLRHLSTTQSPKHSDQKTSTDQNTANSSGHTDNNTANLSGHSDHNTANSSRHSDQSTANLSGHSDHNTANSSRHSDQSTANSSGHFGHNTANLSGHSDQNTANSSGHSDHNTANLSGHSDQSTANSSRHSDNNTANSSRHSDHNTANLSGHSDQSTANLFGHSDQSTANSSRHFDNNPANSSRHSDHNTANSSGHSDQNAAKPLLENTAKEIDEDNADTLIYDDTMQEDMMDVDTQEEEPETESGILAAKLLIENAVIATDEDTLIYDDTMQKHVIDVDTNEEEPETESGTLAAKPVIENAVIAIDENYIANTHIYDDTMQEDMMDIDTQEEEPETELGSYTAKEDSITGKECKHKHDINMKTLTDKVKLETAFIGDVDLTRDSQNDSQEQSDSQESLYILEDDQPVKVHSSKAGRKEDVKLNKSLSYSIDLTESDEHLICLPKVNLITNVNVVNPTRRPARKSPKKRKHPNGNTQTVGDDGGPELALALKLSMNDLHKQSDEEYARKLQKQFDNDVKESMGTNTVVNVIEKSDANVPWQELIDVAARDNAVNVPRTPTHFKSNVESTCTSKAQEDTDFEVAVKYHCDINGRDSYSITPMSSNALTGKPPSKSKVASMRIQNQIEEYRRLQREKNSMTPIGKNSQTHSAPSHSAGSSYSSRIPSSTPSRPSAFVTPTANITPLSSLKPSANARSISSDDDDDDYLPDVGHLLSPTASTPKLSTSHLTPNKSPATVNHSQTSSVYSSGIAQSPSAITGSQDRLSNTTCGNCKGKGHTRVSKHCPAYFSESEVTRRQERADKLRQTKEEKERKLEQLHTQLTENAEQYEQAQRTMIRHFGNTRQIIEQLSKLKKRRRKK